MSLHGPILSPWERGERRRRWIIRAGVVLALFVIACLLDDLAFHAAYAGDRLAAIESKAWYQILRNAGDVRTWVILMFAVWMHDVWASKRDGRAGLAWARPLIGRPAAIVAISAVLGGLLAEVLKVVLSRGRPMERVVGVEGVGGGVGETWRYAGHRWGWPFSGLFDGREWSEFGLPSSHAAVAFAAAFAVARMYPGAGLVALAVAAGCGWTRMIAGRHFLSDVLVGAIVGYAVAWWVCGRWPMKANFQRVKWSNDQILGIGASGEKRRGGSS